MEAQAGRDVVVGYLEPHGRIETTAQAEGLEMIPHRPMRHGDLVLEEMDLPAVLERSPELCLIDELAHTNAPGCEHKKRYEDVEDVLAAGIDVFSTLNIQHLESLNDDVAELTGVRVRETIPDATLEKADELVIIDLTPEALVARLRAGKIYPSDRIGSALSGFFKLENLASLREVALRQIAENVESRRRVGDVVSLRPDRLMTTGGPQAISERLLALVQPDPDGQRVIRRAWRSSQRLGSELDILWVAPPDRAPSGAEQEQLAAFERLGSVLACHFLVESGEVLDVIKRVVKERSTTYILMGPPARWHRLRLRRPLLNALIEELPGVDVRVVSNRAERRNNVEE